MQRARRAALVFTYLASVFALVIACSSNPNKPPEQQYYERLQAANSTYETVMIEVGRTYRDGLIDDTQLAQARTVGHAAELALRTARAALLLYVDTRTPDGRMQLDQALTDAITAVSQLLTSWNSLNHVIHQPR